jgi:6-carboxyhexanoate--CoA ligase
MSRASYYSIRMRASRDGHHISGAEGLYEKEDIDRVVAGYTKRAISHKKGNPDDINIAVEKIKDSPLNVASLPLCTLTTLSTSSARKAAEIILISSGISAEAVNMAFELLTEGEDISGSFLLDLNGKRLMQARKNLRVSRMGIERAAATALSKKLSRLGINNSTVKEALILATKAQHHPGMIGELCISDDPGYTTGYVSTASSGYVRLPHIKRKSDGHGGRVLFVDREKIEGLIEYLKERPVIISSISPCGGMTSLQKIIR